MKPFIPSKLAEIVFALVLFAFAYNHSRSEDAMAGMAIITGMQKTIACYLLEAMLLIFVFTLHRKPAMDGKMGNLLKNTAMAMSAILIGNRNSKQELKFFSYKEHPADMGGFDTFTPGWAENIVMQLQQKFIFFVSSLREG